MTEKQDRLSPLADQQNSGRNSSSNSATDPIVDEASPRQGSLNGPVEKTAVQERAVAQLEPTASVRDVEDKTEFAQDGRFVTFHPSEIISDTLGVDTGHESTNGRYYTDETSRLVRGDVNHGEMGAAGQVAHTQVGSGLAHLTGLGDEANRYGFELSGKAGLLPPLPEDLATGAGLDHLWVLGDFDNYRTDASSPDFDARFPVRDGGVKSYPPLVTGPLAFETIEDTGFTGNILAGMGPIPPLMNIHTQIDPVYGTVTLQPDGTFVFVPALNFSGIAEFSYSIMDPRSGQVFTNTVTMTVAAVADDPMISGAGQFPEDNVGAIPVDVQLFDTDGSEKIGYVEITGVPAHATLGFSGSVLATVTWLAGGGVRLTGDTADIQSALQLLTYTTTTNYSGRDTLNIEVQSIEANVDPDLPGYNDTAVITYPYVIDVIPVADQPPVTGGSYTMDEDARVLLAGLAGALVDTDGSEVLSFEISGVNASARLEDAAGVELSYVIAPDGTKTYSPTPAQITAGVYYKPTANWSGVDDMSITAIATEQANGDQATNSAPITVTVNPQNDLLEISGSSSGNEDQVIGFGANIILGPILDADGSEQLSEVRITGVPPDAVISYGSIPPGAVINYNPLSGTIIVTGSSEADIRAAVAALTLKPEPNSDAEIDLQVSVTTTDAGVTATSTPVTHTITVAAVADAPTLSGSASGVEDQPIPLAISTGLVDTDGSETLSSAEVTVPAGVTLTATSLPAGVTQTAIVGGYRYTFDPAQISTAGIQAFLANNLQVEAPKDSDNDFNVTVKVATTETSPVGGQVALLNNSTTIVIPVTVRPVVDTPTINSVSTVNEDGLPDSDLAHGTPGSQPGAFGSAIEAQLAIGETAAGDTSEAITQVVITGVPASATINTNGNTNIAYTPGTGTITVTGADEATIRAALQDLTIIPGTNQDNDITLGVAVTVRDTDLDNPAHTTSQIFNGTHTITVAAVADAPTLSGSASGVEDQPIPLAISTGLVDTDGSETLSSAEVTVPAGVTLTATSLPAGVTQTAIVGGYRYTFDPAQISTAGIQAFLANNLQVEAPKDSDNDFNVTVKVATTETSPVGGQVALLNNSTTIVIPVTVRPVVDTPTINSVSTVNEDGLPDSDLAHGTPGSQPGAFGSAIEAQLAIGETAAGDTSEAITQVVITGVPANATIDTNANANIVYVPGTAPGTGMITVTGADEAAIRLALKDLTIIPGTNQDNDITLGVAVTVRDTDPDNPAHTTSQIFNGTHTITVAAVADAPSLSATISGYEDQNIPVSIDAGLADTDGSETIKQVVISGVPSGFTLTESSTGAAVLTANGGGQYTVTGPSEAAIQDLLHNLTLTLNAGANPRTNLDTGFDLTVTVTSQESNPSETGPGEIALLENSTTKIIPVTVYAVADPVTHSGSSTLVEDINRNIGADIVFNKIDTDGSEAVTEVTVSGFPTGATVTYEPVGGGARVTVSGTTLTLSGGSEAEIRAALASLEIQAPAQSDVDFNLTITATTTDHTTSPNTADHTATTTWTHAVMVQAVADAPSIATSHVSGDEDTRIILDIEVNRSIDGSDNSEVLSVRITVPQDAGSPIGTVIAIALIGHRHAVDNRTCGDDRSRQWRLSDRGTRYRHRRPGRSRTRRVLQRWRFGPAAACGAFWHLYRRIGHSRRGDLDRNRDRYAGRSGILWWCRWHLTDRNRLQPNRRDDQPGRRSGDVHQHIDHRAGE